MKIEFKQIGTIYSSFKRKEEIPCQGYRTDKIGTIRIFKEYEKALEDIEGFSHIYLIYYFHKHTGFKPLIKPFLDDKKHGLFATRYFNRPNPIGISVVELLERNKNILKVKPIDVLDKTPLLDIKPYVPMFDQRKNVRVGWLEGKKWS
jgi:tRNA-Thr(GGU) m(6)t(6)A37 methyltransferase TsaA